MTKSSIKIKKYDKENITLLVYITNTNRVPLCDLRPGLVTNVGNCTLSSSGYECYASFIENNRWIKWISKSQYDKGVRVI
jgi:hypothetical protein